MKHDGRHIVGGAQADVHQELGYKAFPSPAIDNRTAPPLLGEQVDVSRWGGNSDQEAGQAYGR